MANPINPHLAALKETYTSPWPPTFLRPPSWEQVALIISAAAIAILGNSVFAAIGMGMFVVNFFEVTVRVTNRQPTFPSREQEWDNTEARRILAIPGFFEWAMARNPDSLMHTALIRAEFQAFTAAHRQSSQCG